MSTLGANFEERRYALVALAAQRERASRSRGLLVIAVLAILGATIALGLGLLAQQRAGNALTRENRKALNILTLTEQLRQLDQRDTSETDALVGEPIANLYSRVQELARRAGLKNEIRLPGETQVGQGAGVRRLAYRYTTNDPSLENLLHWIDLVIREIPQMQVRSIKLAPLAGGWSLEVAFSRWERTQRTETR
ncbi:MAG: hypothetical protein RBS39_08895 [Phycisphaerales bacterium]|jgi:hypothetical protein|nr:hypothetical protein [Phycisphaerales bacterium]